MPSTRQLAAIMFTDIVRYTALMGDDEQKAFELLNKNRLLQKPIIEQYHGRWIKELGDGVLASFNTVSDAVNAAIKIQEACNLAKEFLLRIGIHQGEVVFEVDDIFGDAVNIASRIQAIATPGGIYISESVHNNVSNKHDITTQFVKQEVLKNVKEPVKIYEVIIAGSDSLSKTSPTEKEQIRAEAARKSANRRILVGAIAILSIGMLSYFLISLLTNKKSTITNKWLAILPFRLISNDSSIEWLSDGFTEELTSSIAGISDLKVKSPTTMMQYKNSKKSIREIGEELNVSNIIDGSLQKEGNIIIINARLINPATEEIIRTFPFRKDASEIKSIYSEVAQQVADIMNASLTSEEKKRLQQTVKVDPEIYNFNLRALQLLRKITPQADMEALALIEQALVKDTNSAEALIGKATYFLNQSVWTGRIYPEEASKKIFPLLKRAVAIDSNLSLAYTTSGLAKMYLEWDLIGAQKELIMANKIDPSNDVTTTGLIFLDLYRGNFSEAYNMCEKGKAFSPNSWWIDVAFGMTLYFQNKIPETIQHFKYSIYRHGHPFFYERLGWIFLLNGQNQEAIDILEKPIKQFNIRPSQTLALLAEAYYKTGKSEKAKLILNELENKVFQSLHNTAIYLAMTYASIGAKEKALHFLDKAYELHDVDIVWLKEEPHFKSIQNEVRYKEMLNKVGF